MQEHRQQGARKRRHEQNHPARHRKAGKKPGSAVRTCTQHRNRDLRPLGTRTYQTACTAPLQHNKARHIRQRIQQPLERGGNTGKIHCHAARKPCRARHEQLPLLRFAL